MKDFGALMKQAQVMQQKLADAQSRLAELSIEGSAGGGLVKVTLRGTGALVAVEIDDSLLVSGEGETVGDLVVAAHAAAKTQLDSEQAVLMRDAAGPLAGMNLPGMPKF
jgi:DNA-binding YbaB/EbfC family protein